MSNGLTFSIKFISANLLNHFHRRIIVSTGLLINVMFMHGHMADELLSSVLVSIPKDARGR